MAVGATATALIERPEGDENGEGDEGAEDGEEDCYGCWEEGCVVVGVVCTCLWCIGLGGGWLCGWSGRGR